MGDDQLRAALPSTRGGDRGDQDLARDHAAHPQPQGGARAPQDTLGRGRRHAPQVQPPAPPHEEGRVHRTVQPEAARQAGGRGAADRRRAELGDHTRARDALHDAHRLHLPLREPDLPRLPRPRGHRVELPRRARQPLRGPHPLVPAARGGPHLSHLHHAEPGRHPLAVRGKLRGQHQAALCGGEGLDTRVAHPEWEVPRQDRLEVS
mmetsp:Transcript_27626/g.69986  ORF Transcript_27626/g.69986 Transcript_27626/m.69986 type:complete len:207 (+) Transcript_27626:630-1250(+)